MLHTALSEGEDVVRLRLLGVDGAGCVARAVSVSVRGRVVELGSILGWGGSPVGAGSGGAGGGAGGGGGNGLAGGSAQVAGHVNVKMSTTDAPPQVSDELAAHPTVQLPAGAGPEHSGGRSLPL
eukprot:SAG31_NODE_271_length_18717_cov_8.685949_25_plen_124_part_00